MSFHSPAWLTAPKQGEFIKAIDMMMEGLLIDQYATLDMAGISLDSWLPSYRQSNPASLAQRRIGM